MTPRIAGRRLIWWLSVMASAQSLSSAAILTEVIGLKGAGLFQAIIAAASAGTAVFVGATRAPDAEDQAPPPVAVAAR